MDVSCGIGVGNRYAVFLNEDEDILDALKIQEEEKKTKRKNKLLEKETKIKHACQTSFPTPSARNESKEIKKVRNSVGRNGMCHNDNINRLSFPEAKQKTTSPPDDIPDKINRATFISVELNGAESDRNGKENKYRSSNRKLMGRGLITSTTKREYDRHSGSFKTGVKPIDKREGNGARNWGNHKDDIVDYDSFVKENQVSRVPDKAEGDVPFVVESQQNHEGKASIPPTERVTNVLTLDEYYAKRGNRQKPVYNTRKAGEGEDLSQWKKMYSLRKKSELPEEQENEACNIWDFPQRAGRQKYLLDINFQFTDAPLRMSNRGRGTVRRPEMEADKSFDRGDIYYSQEQQQNALKVFDENDFPSL